MKIQTNNDSRYQRHSTRLKGYDYSQPGGYFITLVTHERQNLFGTISDDGMHLNEFGQIVWNIWFSLSTRYPQISLGAAIVMPNHFHGIIQIHDNFDSGVGAIHELPLPKSSPLEDFVENKQKRREMLLPLIVGYLKMNSAKQINQSRFTSGLAIWQRNYHEHIIRSEREYEEIIEYIESNPFNWATDNDNI